MAHDLAQQDERGDGFPHQVFDQLAARGLFRIPFREEGLQHPATAVAVEELAYHSNSIAAVFDVHCILAGNALAQGTDQQQQQTWLTRIVVGSITYHRRRRGLGRLASIEFGDHQPCRSRGMTHHIGSVN